MMGFWFWMAIAYLAGAVTLAVAAVLVPKLVLWLVR